MIAAPEIVKVDLSFSLRGVAIPADHGYALFAALCRHLPWLHGNADVGVHPIDGTLLGGRRLALGRQSRLVLRLPAGRIAETLPVAGKSLDVDGSSLTVGVPSVKTLVPATSLRSRLVVIRGFTDGPAFLEAAARQLTSLGVQGDPHLVARGAEQSVEGNLGRVAGEPLRRTLRVRDKQIVGFAVLVTGLSSAESVQLQEAGIGGRHRFGCGLFVPYMASGGRR